MYLKSYTIKSHEKCKVVVLMSSTLRIKRSFRRGKRQKNLKINSQDTLVLNTQCFLSGSWRGLEVFPSMGQFLHGAGKKEKAKSFYTGIC